ncbi:hypothetical protein ABGF49_08345 [Helcococcus ovis]|uniref:Uncharacterized protein n=1 Tax=Helcococcus ovis TaxID=72026 RepID=A0A4R9C3P1_9FIRM|nr:hypothetical protein [Helcococcus ovis]TFF63983.1 hypothetical protein EQF92_07635 [Helcococcus ovis]TFF65690.1 hypothetical protein EQF91_05485 [Helcococcus ovis]
MILENKKYYGYYKKNLKQLIRPILFILGLFIIFLYAKYIGEFKHRNIYIFLMEIFLVTFLYDMFWKIFKNNKTNYIISDSSKKSIKMFKKLIALAYILLISVFVLSLIYKIENNIFTLIVIFTFAPAAIYFQLLIVIFFDEYYYSGEYKIFYKEIDRLKILKEVSSTDGLAVYFELKKGNEVIGYDKMMLDNFLLLKSKIEENNKKI